MLKVVQRANASIQTRKKRGNFFVKIQVSRRRGLTKPEKNVGGHNLLLLKHFPCITRTQETNTKSGLRSPNLRGPWDQGWRSLSLEGN